LDQGPFDIEQDKVGKRCCSHALRKPLRNPGLAVGYSWEESGPSWRLERPGELEQHVEKISSLPFVDVLYIRCDWRNVQSALDGSISILSGL